jgi:hypothetical protein
MIIGVKGKVLPHPDGCIIDIENGTINGVLLVKGLKIEGDEVGIVLHKLLTTHESST